MVLSSLKHHFTRSPSPFDKPASNHPSIATCLSQTDLGAPILAQLPMVAQGVTDGAGSDEDAALLADS